jgi:hypothetical protein
VSALEARPLRAGLAAVYVPKALTAYERAELRIRLGLRRPADLELVARYRRKGEHR